MIDFLITSMLFSYLLEINDRCEDYGMKININKMKIMDIDKKPTCKLKMYPSNKWAASSTWGAISVAT